MANTPANQTFTQLFWLDFMRYVFVPKFKRQNGVKRIASFDTSAPVVMSDSLDLTLPTPLETAIYYAENVNRPPIEFQINLNQIYALIMGVVLLIGLLVLAMLVKPNDSAIYRMI